MIFKYAIGLLALLHAAAPTCLDIPEVACSNEDFTLLCTALDLADLVHPLSEGHWTVFAPTDEAFLNLGDVLDVVLADKRLLTDVLLFHAVDEVISADDLECTGRIEMANGQDSRTVCRDHDFFQKGGSNPRNNPPQIVVTDIETCQGFIHVVDEVLLPGRLRLPSPPPPPGDCQSITEIACGIDDFSTLCAALDATGLDEVLEDGLFTVFAPTNEAFSNIQRTVDYLLENDLETLAQILLFHVVAGEEVFEADLGSTHLIEMANGKDSRTVCRGREIFQKGRGNSPFHRPKIIDTDIGACNGVVHVVDQVLLF